MKSILVVFFLSLSSFIYCYSQPVFFEKNWGGSNYDYARSVRQLSDGSIYVFGFSDAGTHGGFDYALNKLDRYGNLKWTKYYGDSLDDNGIYMNVTSDGNLIVVGESYISQSDIDIKVYKIDTSGAVIWSKDYGTSAGNESARSIIQTADGGYALCGFKTDSSGSNDNYVIKMNSTGDTMWTKMVGGIDNDYASGIRETPGGYLVVSADTRRSIGLGGYDVELFMLDQLDGNVVWDRFYGDSLNNGSQGVKISLDGHIYCWGETEVYHGSPFDFYIEKSDTLGNSKWKKVFGTLKADAVFSLCEQSDKSLVLTGYSNGYNSGPLDLVVLKTDSSGNMQWIRNYGDVGIDIGYEIIQSLDNGFLVCGTTDRGTPDYYLLHLDTMGTMMGINESHSNEIFSIYPNPSAGIISVGCLSNPLVQKISYKVISTIGEVIYSGLIDNNSLSFQGIIPSGIYFLELNNGVHSEMKKIVVTSK